MWTHWIGPNPGNWRKHNKTLFHRTNPFETVVFRGYPNHYKGNKFKEDTNVNHLRHRKSQVIKSYTPFQMIQTGWSCPMLLVTLLKKTKPILNPRVMWTHWIGPNPGNWRKQNKTLFNSQNPLKNFFSEDTRTVTRITSLKKIQTSTIWNTGNPKSLNHSPPFKWFLTGWSCPMLLVTLLKKTKPILNPRVMWTHWIGPNLGNWRKQNKTLFNSQNPLKNFFSEDTRTVTRITSS